MKKTTKKLISNFLSLLMVLSLIPMGSMTAFAIDVSPATLPTKLAGNDVTWNGNWHATSFDGDVTIYCPYEGTSITSNGTIYWDGTTSYPNKVSNLTVGTYNCPCGCNGSFTLGPTVDFTKTHYYCSVCNEFISNVQDDVLSHVMSEHSLSFALSFVYTIECSISSLCGEAECPNVASAIDLADLNVGDVVTDTNAYTNKSNLWFTFCDDCKLVTIRPDEISADALYTTWATGKHQGHDLGRYYEASSFDNLVGYTVCDSDGNTSVPQTYTISISSGGVYDIPEGAYSATSEDTIKIKNSTLDQITVFVENWSDSIPLNYYYAAGDTTYTLPPFPAGKHVNGITTSGDSITFTLADDQTAPEWLETIVTKVEACSDELVADVEGTPATLSATVEGVVGAAFGDFVDAMNKKEYSQDDSVYTIKGELGSSILTVDVTLDANEDVVSVKLVAENEGVEYINYTFTYPSTTPEWAETIVAKVDASADKLVDDQGTPFANMLMGGKFADTFNQYESFEYDNDGSVYTIKGIGNGADGEFIITLDSNEDVASLVTNFYAAGTLMFAVTYTPVPPHTCTLAKKNGQAATCTKDGWKAYYQCKDKACGKIYATNNASGTAYDTLTAWKASKAGKIAKTGHSYTSAVTKKATYSAEGVRTYTCSKCGNKYTKAIAKLELTSDAKYSNSTKMNAGFKVSSSTKNVTVNWGKVAGADGYMIYAAYCGNDTKAQLIKTIKGVDTKTYTFTKLNGKNIDLTKNMKVYVVAYSTIDGKKVQVGKSIVGHVVGGKSKKYTNSTKVTVKNSNVTLAVNKTSKISATVTYKDATKKPVGDSHAPAKRYRSSNKAVATVDANGKITAVGKGTCTVYVFAKNGTSAKVTVTVK